MNPDIILITISLMIWRDMMKKQMKIEEAILYCLASQNRRMSESRIKLACIMPSEEEEDEVKCLLRQKDGLC